MHWTGERLWHVRTFSEVCRGELELRLSSRCVVELLSVASCVQYNNYLPNGQHTMRLTRKPKLGIQINFLELYISNAIVTG